MKPFSGFSVIFRILFADPFVGPENLLRFCDKRMFWVTGKLDEI
jgi:hypothetical protein